MRLRAFFFVEVSLLASSAAKAVWTRAMELTLFVDTKSSGLPDTFTNHRVNVNDLVSMVPSATEPF
jgi:hypothetical protein